MLQKWSYTVILIIIFLLLLFIKLTSSITCYSCSSPNIENHYGSFFENPREIQEYFVGKVNDCSKSDSQSFQKCPGGFCFSLNISTSNYTESDFGYSYGCALHILPEDVFDAETGDSCVIKTIPIRTSPVYTVTATYCSCRHDNCNPPIHQYSVKRKQPPVMKSSDSHYHMPRSESTNDNSNYCYRSTMNMFLLSLFLFFEQ